MYPISYTDCRDISKNFLDTLSAKSSDIKALISQIAILALNCYKALSDGLTQCRQVVRILSITPDMHGKKEVFLTLWAIPGNDRSCVIEKALPLIMDPMNRGQQKEIIQIAARIPADQREAVLFSLGQLLAVESQSHIVNALADVSDNEIAEFIFCASALIPDRATSYYSEEILNALKGVDADQRGDFTNVSNLVANIYGFYRKEIICTTATISADQRANFIEDASAFIDQMDEMHQTRIIQTIARVYANQRQDVIPQALKLISPLSSFDGTDRITTIEDIEKIPADQMQEFDLFAQELITDEMNRHERRSIISALAQIYVSQEQGVIPQALSLISSQMSSLTKVDILQAMQTLDADQREDVASFASQLQFKMDTSMIQTIAGIPSDQRQNFIDHAQQLITDQMQELDKKHIIYALEKIYGHQKQETIPEALKLISLQMSSIDKVLIIEAAAKLDLQQLRDVVHYALQLITDQTESYYRVDIINAIYAIGADQRQSFIDHTHQLIPGKINDLDSGKIIAGLAKIYDEQKQEVIPQALFLISAQMQSADKIAIIQAVAELDVQQREDIIDRTCQLITNNMEGWHRLEMLKTIKAIDADQRQEIVAYAQQLMTPEMPPHNKIEIIAAITGVLWEQRADVMNHSLILITSQMSGRFKAHIIQAISETREDQRDAFIHHLRQVFTERIHANSQLMEAIVAIPANERVDVIDSMSQLVADEMDEGDRIGFIRMIARIRSDARAEVVAHARRLWPFQKDRISRMTAGTDHFFAGYHRGIIMGEFAEDIRRLESMTSDQQEVFVYEFITRRGGDPSNPQGY